MKMLYYNNVMKTFKQWEANLRKHSIRWTLDSHAFQEQTIMGEKILTAASTQYFRHKGSGLSSMICFYKITMSLESWSNSKPNKPGAGHKGLLTIEAAWKFVILWTCKVPHLDVPLFSKNQLLVFEIGVTPSSSSTWENN